MHALGMFPNDRELLVCPNCGLREDILFSGVLIAYREPAFLEDTGLRFEKRTEDTFRCPSCGQSVREPLADDSEGRVSTANAPIQRSKPTAPARGRNRTA